MDKLGNPLPSTRFIARASEWPSTVRDRVFEAPHAVSDTSLLRWFRALHPYYQHSLAHVRTLETAPTLEKASIQDLPPLPVPGGRLIPITSSGTSGTLVTVHNSEEELRFRRVLMYRPFMLYDLPEEVRQVSFVDDVGSRQPVLNAELLGRRYVRWQIAAHSPVEAQVALLREVQPHVLTGFASAMVRLAEESPTLPGTRELVMLSPGGELIPESWRRILEERYRVPVNDRYGATETGAIAWQCPHCRRYHANVDEMTIEPLEDGCVITPWFLTQQPLLRYRLGDTLAWDDSDEARACSVRLPTIRIERARRDDWLIDGTGSKVSPLAFHFERFEGLTAWRVHQDGSGGITAFVSIRGGLTPCARESLRDEVRSVVVGRTVRVVEGAWRSPRVGKYKRVSSLFVGDARVGR